MKIFFLAAIQGKSELAENYKFVAEKIKTMGHKLTSDYLFDVSREKFENWKDSQELLDFHKKIIEDIKRSDMMVVEVTFERLSLGYWISLALELGKPTIALCRKGEKYHLLETLEISQKFTLYEYSDLNDLGKELPMLIDFASEQQDTRFNFFISPKHQSYLDWISKNKKIPRSVYLREMIEADMRKNEEFQQASAM